MGAPLRIVKTTCPWCPASFMGPSAFKALFIHVEKEHFDKFDELKKMKREEYTELTLSSAGLAKQADIDRMKEEEKQLEEAAILRKQEERARVAEEKKAGIERPRTPIPFEPNKISIPLENVLEPADWMTEFLQKFNVSEKFIIFQVEKLKITNKLPAPMDLETDLNELDSGSKGKRQNSYIRWFYENAIVDYKQKREAASLPFDQISGVSIDYQQRPSKPINFQMEHGFSVAEPQRQTFREQGPYSPTEKDELRMLRERLEQIEREKYEAVLQRNRDLELKIEQQRQMTPMQDPVMTRMEAKLEAIEQENRRLQGELSAQAQQNILTAVNEAKQMASNVPNIDSIRALVSEELQRKEGKMTKEEIDQMIRNQIDSKTTRITSEDVEIKKIDRQYDIEKAKLDADKSKGDMWGETIKSVAAIFGENLGKGLSSMGQGPSPPPQQFEQPPVQETQQKVKTCPSCSKSMIFNLPPGVNIGQCPYCGVPIEILPTGDLAIYSMATPEVKKPEPPPTPPKVTVKQPVDESIGMCAGCREKLYNHNIASTDIDGKQWCKNCSKG